MSGVPYTKAKANFTKAPKGKIPYIEENGKLLGDSTFIRLYLEKEHGAKFDGNLTPEEKAVALAFPDTLRGTSLLDRGGPTLDEQGQL